MTKRIPHLLVSILLLRTVGSAQLQPPVTAPPGVSDYQVFRFFFRHVNLTEGYADQLLSKGEYDSSQRHWFKNMANLTDAEEALLKNVAGQANTAIDAFDKRTATLAKQWRTLYPAPTVLPASAFQELRDRNQQQQQIVASYINALKTGMAPDRFQSLHSFVWSTEALKIRKAGGWGPPPRLLPPLQH